jgi:TolA-binding protein
MHRRIRTTLALAVLAAAGSVLAACMSKSEGDALRSEHGGRLDALEKGMRTERDELRAELTKAKQQVAELQEVLERATAVVTRNSADLGAEVEQLRAQLGRLEGQIAEIRNTSEQTARELTKMRDDIEKRLESVSKRATGEMTVPDSEIPQDRLAHFQAAYRAYQSADYPRARAIFRAYVTRYRQDDQADNAQYWIGKSYLMEDRPATALGELRRVISDFPSGDSADEALFDMADAFYRLHACTDARTALQALIQGHPRSPLLSQARDKVRQIQRAPRGYCTS